MSVSWALFALQLPSITSYCSPLTGCTRGGECCIWRHSTMQHKGYANGGHGAEYNCSVRTKQHKQRFAPNSQAFTR
eukprot:scaffold90529_cov18-Tisochrysis_lutea.AAC.2